jgi:hypothetical protein
VLGVDYSDKVIDSMITSALANRLNVKYAVVSPALSVFEGLFREFH